MQYPHWLMVAGAVLVVIGFIGFAFHKNNAGPVENNPEQPRQMMRQTLRGRSATLN